MRRTALRAGKSFPFHAARERVARSPPRRKKPFSLRLPIHAPSFPRIDMGEGGEAMRGKGAFLRGAAVLMGGTLLLRLSGILFRSYICLRIGDAGMGLYQLIFSLFALAVTACTSGLGLAVTRLAAEGGGALGTLRRCVLLALSASLLAGGALWAGSEPLALSVLGSELAVRPLRILACGLPFMACCACLKGWFLAEQRPGIPTAADVLEQAVSIGAGLALLNSLPPLEALMLGSTLGEAASFTLTGLCFLRCARGRKRGTPAPLRGILRIAVPVVSSSFTRSGLSSLENLLVPRGFRLHGADLADSLSQYGRMQAVAMPVILFPAALVTSMCQLLIPKLAFAASRGDKETIRNTAGRAIRFTLAFSFFITTLLIVFADPLCRFFFQSAEAGNLLRIMAPIVPLMYVDSVVDGMLKGLDQQLFAFRCNLADSLLRVAAVAVFLPLWGMAGYAAVLFFSEIFNASLSIYRLLRVTELDADPVTWVLLPAVGAALLYYLLVLLPFVG